MKTLNSKEEKKMKNSTKNIANEMGLRPISIWTALKLMLKGYRPGICWGFKHGKGIRAWRTK